MSCEGVATPSPANQGNSTPSAARKPLKNSRNKKFVRFFLGSHTGFHRIPSKTQIWTRAINFMPAAMIWSRGYTVFIRRYDSPWNYFLSSALQSHFFSFRNLFFESVSKMNTKRTYIWKKLFLIICGW